MVENIENIKNTGYARPPFGKGMTSHATSSAKNSGKTGYFKDTTSPTKAAISATEISTLAVFSMYAKTNMAKKPIIDASTAQTEVHAFRLLIVFVFMASWATRAPVLFRLWPHAIKRRSVPLKLLMFSRRLSCVARRKSGKWA